MRTRVVALTVAVISIAAWFVIAEKAIGAERPREAVAERIQDLNLTDEQEAKIAEIRKEWRPKVEEAAKPLAALVTDEVEKVRAVLTVEQLNKVPAMREVRKERRSGRLAERLAHLDELELTDAEMTKLAGIREEYRPKIAKALEGLRGTLSDEQRRTREDALKAGKKHKEVMESLNLTGEQKEKIKTSGKEVAAFVREEMAKIRDVLSPEQEEKLVDLKDERRENARDRSASAIAHSKDLNLTDDQKSKIAAVRQEYRGKIHEAGSKLRAAVREELAAIIAVVKD